jgi:hypothetical protein
MSIRELMHPFPHDIAASPDDIGPNPSLTPELGRTLFWAGRKGGPGMRMCFKMGP